MKPLSVILALVSFAAGSTQPAMPIPPRLDLMRIDLTDRAEIEELDRLGCVIDEVRKNGDNYPFSSEEKGLVVPFFSCIAEVPPDLKPVIQTMTSVVRESTLQEDISGTYYRNSFTRSAGGRYLTYEEYRDTMNVIAMNNPGICKLETLGTTEFGNLILTMRVSSKGERRMEKGEIPPLSFIPSPSSLPCPAVLFEGGIHGDEKIGWAVCFEFLKYLVSNYGSDPAVTNLVDTREIWISPMFNPDGYTLGTRGNSRGKDLNRNWGWMWGRESGCGPSAFSERENVAALENLWRRPFALYVSYHAGTTCIVYPWSYSNDSIPERRAIDWLSAGYSTRGNHYQYGQGSQLMYYANGVSKDYGYGTQGDLSWSIELNYSKTPPASEIEPTFNINRDAMLYLCREAGHGIHGTVTDSVTGQPLHAQISVNDWPSFTDAASGDFQRFCLPGTYSVTVRCPGYKEKTADIVVPATGDSTVTIAIQLNLGRRPSSVIYDPSDVGRRTPDAGCFGFRVLACSAVAQNANRTYPVRALGPRDGRAYQLDNHQWVIIDLDRPVVNSAGPDLSVFRSGGTGSALVEAANDWRGPWTTVGIAESIRTNLDIGAAGLDSARYLRVRASGVFLLDAVEQYIAVTDAEAIALVQPYGSVDSGTVIVPRAMVCNNSSTTRSVGVELQIGTWRDSTTVALASGASETLSFAPWTATARGRFATQCSTRLSGDESPGNDVQIGSVVVPMHDVGVRAITAPAGTLPPEALSPQVHLHNYGAGREPMAVFLSISSLPLYGDSAWLASGLPVGVDTIVTFHEWAAPLGAFDARCSVVLAGDENPDNNVAVESGEVIAAPPGPGWVRMADVPAGARNRKVKDGGCLTMLTQSDPSDRSDIYCLKGNNTCEFYAYGIAANAWQTRDSIPAMGRSGRNARIRKGAALCAASGAIYAVKGGGTLGFWVFHPSYRSDPSGPWVQLTDIPAGAKAVKEGSGMTVVQVGDTTFVYLLKGSGTGEFYRYNTVSNAWQALPDAPPGNSGKTFKNGSCLTGDGENAIYALKASYNEFFVYDIAGNTWLTRPAMPMYGRTGKKKKAGGGAAMTYASGNWGLSQGFRPTKSGAVPEFPRLGADAASSGSLYALKGGNTQEFWLYRPSWNDWVQYDDVPLGGGKKVKGGGALASSSYPSYSSHVYALKGNNTTEFWRFAPGAANGLQRTADDPQAQAGLNPRASSLKLNILPNPFCTATTITYALPRPGACRLGLYDVTGKLVSVLAEGYRSAGLSTFNLQPSVSGLASGVYLLKLELDARSLGLMVTTAKLVIE
jgi:hypothetical protein